MGVTGLLPLFKSVQTKTHIYALHGQTVAVDAYVWLHKGAFSCSVELALGQPTLKYIEYAMNKVRMLRHFGVEPFIVFDGGHLPSKMATEQLRQENRQIARQFAIDIRNSTNGDARLAEPYFQRAVDISPEMAASFMYFLRKEKVAYVVAPYEADAQLAYLEKTGKVTAIISEDSDLLVFGAKRLLTKLEDDGSCIEIRRDKDSENDNMRFKYIPQQELRHMAILAGCDYTKGIRGIGLIKAHGYLSKYKTLANTIRALRFQDRPIENGFEKEARLAEDTFLYQRVFDIDKGKLVYLNQPENSLDPETDDTVGPQLDSSIAKGIAEGTLHPMSKRPLVPYHAELLDLPLPVINHPPWIGDPTGAKKAAGRTLSQALSSSSSSSSPSVPTATTKRNFTLTEFFSFVGRTKTDQDNNYTRVTTAQNQNDDTPAHPFSLASRKLLTESFQDVGYIESPFFTAKPRRNRSDESGGEAIDENSSSFATVQDENLDESNNTEVTDIEDDCSGDTTSEPESISDNNHSNNPSPIKQQQQQESSPSSRHDSDEISSPDKTPDKFKTPARRAWTSSASITTTTSTTTTTSYQTSLSRFLFSSTTSNCASLTSNDESKIGSCGYSPSNQKHTSSSSSSPSINILGLSSPSRSICTSNNYGIPTPPQSTSPFISGPKKLKSNMNNFSTKSASCHRSTKRLALTPISANHQRFPSTTINHKQQQQLGSPKRKRPSHHQDENNHYPSLKGSLHSRFAFRDD